MYDTNGYLGFTFAGRHSSEFGLLVVSDGSRYHQNSYNQFSDTVINVPGKNGGYYYGTSISVRDFDINCVFYDITPHIMHKIQHWLYPDVIGWLIFDEQPYKRYLVKVSAIPVFNFVPFDELKELNGYNFQKEVLKGEVNFSFFTMDEYGYYNPEYEIPAVQKDRIVQQQALDSGIIPSNYIRKNIFLPYENVGDLKIIINDKDDPTKIHTIKPQYENYLSKNKIFSLYNAGNGVAKADFYLIIKNDDNDPIQWPLEINNFDDGAVYRINNPSEIIKKKCDNLNNIKYYRIEILSSKQEIYIIGLNNSKVNITDRINIGACYNHFFPKIYHKKPTETCIFTQVVNYTYGPEPLLYTYSYSLDSLRSSDEKDNKGTFEEFQQFWNDYTILSEYNTYEVNNIISPAVIFIDYPKDYDYVQNDERILNKRLCYLVYPNKFICNNKLENFVAKYDHTYI